MPGRRARSCSCTTSVASSSAASIRATRTASAFERCWRAEVMNCAILRAGRHIPLPDGPAVSTRRCRVAHSPTTRRLPPNPAARSRRHNCAPLKRQPGGQAVLAEAENVFALAADNPAGHAAAEPGRAHDPLARNSVVGHVPDHPVDRLPALKAFVVQPFGRREQPRVESGGADGAVDSRHLSPHGGEKGCACVLEKMPAIGDLERLWQGTRHGAAIAPVAVAGHDLYLGPRPRSASTVAGSRSGRRSMTCRRSRSQISLPFRSPRRQAQSSMPITGGLQAVGSVSRRRLRWIVSLLTGRRSLPASAWRAIGASEHVCRFMRMPR